MSWKDIVASVAPTIASALGGPFAGMAATKALQLFNIAPEAGNEEAQLKQAMATATPEQLGELKKIDNEFKLEMEKLGVEREHLAGVDRASARDREISLKDNAPKILACVVVLGFFVTLGAVAFGDIADKAMQPINILLGALTALLMQVGNYYFGSNSSSARKTELLGKSKPS